MKIIPVCAAALCVLLACCEHAEEPLVTGQGSDQGGTDTSLPVVKTDLGLGIEPWRDDFPYALHQPPGKPGRWYDRNAQQALEKIVANVSGLCTPDAWRMAKEFFDRHQARTRDLLIEKLDETMRSRFDYDHAETLLQVIARQRDPAYADVIVRAAAHSHPGIHRAAYQALVNAGSEAAVMAVLPGFARLNRIEQGDWIRAAARHLSDENLFPLFREMLTKQQFSPVQAAVFDESMSLPPARARELFDPIWSSMPDDLQLHIAGIMHAAGDGRGTARIRHALRPPIEEVKRKIVAVQGAMRGDLAPLADELLALTNEDHKGLNLHLLAALRRIPGQPVDDTLLTLTDNRYFELRQHALLALAERGKTTELDALVEVVRTEPEGSKLRAAIADVVGARYGKAVPALLERLRKGSRKSEQYYVRMIARINRPESFAALREVFLRPEYLYPWRERHSNVTFMGVQFSNADTCVEQFVKLLDSLPREEYRRRAALIHALANMAGGRDDPKIKAPIYQALRRRVFDAAELPQVRILALDYLRKDVRIEDAMQLKAMQAKEPRAMRQYFSNYLFEFF